jgi:hypothetical protein
MNTITTGAMTRIITGSTKFDSLIIAENELQLKFGKKKVYSKFRINNYIYIAKVEFI